MRFRKLVLAALAVGVFMAVTPSVLALTCDQMFSYRDRTCFLSGEDTEWCYYACY